ncbi:MAG: DUF2723 domain-containing protein [Chloroflexi bacterium]|nr:DUF2723 domain-containing protein [Chloroflexota bacterium]
MLLPCLSPAKRALASAGLAGAVALVVYWRTAFPTVHIGDAAEFSTAVPTLGIVHPPGYPTYLLLARAALSLAPADPARFLNLFSGACAAVSVALLALLVSRLTGSAVAAFAASLFFAFTHYQWIEATVATPYTLNTLWLLMVVLLIVSFRARPRPFPAAAIALLAGLWTGVHLSSVLQAPGFAALLVGARPRWLWSGRRLTGLAALFGLALAVWLYVPIRAAADPPFNWARLAGLDLTRLPDLWTYWSADVFREQTFGFPLQSVPGQLAEAASWWLANEVGIGVVFGLIGWRAQLARDRLLALSLSAGFLLHCFYYANWDFLNRDTMFLPAYLLWAVWVGEGLAVIIRGVEGRGAALLAVCVLLLPTLPFVVYFGRDDASQNRLARQFSEPILLSPLPHGAIMAFWLEFTPLRYLQVVEGLRPDVELIDLNERYYERKRMLRARGITNADVLNDLLAAAAEREIRDRLARGQDVHLTQRLRPNPRGFSYERAGAAYRAVLSPTAR